MTHLAPARIVHLMRVNRITIAALAAKMDVPRDRVRQVRSNGVRGYMLVCDWYQGITGVDIYDPARMAREPQRK